MALFARAEAFLNRAMNATRPAAVTYTRYTAGFTSKTEVVVPEGEGVWAGQVVFREVRDGVSRLSWGDREYLIEAAAIAEVGEPKEGDTVTETINGAVCVFRVLPPDTGEPAWRWSDNTTRTRYRVHTKQVR